MGKKIGIYGGSFDPIHLGHVNIAFEILQIHGLDEVWFCPAAINPHKMEGSTASAIDRLNMLNLVLAETPFFKVLTLELDRKGPSYTVDTLRELVYSQQNQSDPDQYFFIMGDDAIKNFHKWHHAEEIVNLVPLLIGQRMSRVDPNDLNGSAAIIGAIKSGLTPTRVMEISSSEIRHRLSNKMYCGHLLQAKVLDYILSHHLYFSV